MNPAAKVRAHKAEHPEKYCTARGCLWMTGGQHGSPCRKHPYAAQAAAAMVKFDALIEDLKTAVQRQVAK